jgi:hypothetical protein
MSKPDADDDEVFYVDGIRYDRHDHCGVNARRQMFEILDDHHLCFECGVLPPELWPSSIFPGTGPTDEAFNDLLRADT